MTLDRNTHHRIMQNILIDIYRDFTLATRLIFKGDTACYFLYGLDRFSTDLDFNITNEYESADILNRLRKILIKYGTLREERIKRYTIFCMLSYGSSEHNIKVEISTRGHIGETQRVNFYGLGILTMSQSSIFAHKLYALTNRPNLANRDLYDLHFFFRNTWSIDYSVLEALTGKDRRVYMIEVLQFLQQIPPKHSFLQGLGEVLSESQKYSVKHHLLSELMIMIDGEMRMMR